MRLVASQIFLVALGSSSALAHTGDLDELRHLKEVLWPQAYRERDVELLDSILHADFAMTGANGAISTRADELAQLPDSTWPHESFRFEIQRLDIYHGNTAIVAGQGRASGTGSDGPYCYTYQSTNVLIRSEGRWRAVTSHVSGVQRDCR